MPACFVKGCPHRTGQKLKYPNVTLHPFPKNFNMIKNWVQQTGQPLDNIDQLSQKILEGKKENSYRMCSCHFTIDCYMTRGSRTVLKPTAVPTVFSSNNQPPLYTVTSFKERLQIATNTEGASTSSIVVRVANRLHNVHTQTDFRILQHDQYCNTEHWFNQRTVATQTDPPDNIPGIVTKPDQNCLPCIRDSVPDHSRSNLTPQKRSLNKGCDSKPKRQILETDVPELFLPSPIPPKDPEVLGLSVGNTEAVTKQFTDPAYDPQKETLAIKSSYQSHHKFVDVLLTRDYTLERKFIVYESCLDKLLLLIRCQHHSTEPCCASIADIKKIMSGSQILVLLRCQNKHLSLHWVSQPVEGNTSVGNIQMAASILFSGASFKKVEEMYSLFGIQAISRAAYCRYQRAYLFPAIRYQWELEQQNLKKGLRGKAVILAGGGRFDKPCHKFYTYTLIDSFTQQIVNFKINEVGSGKSSVDIGKETFQMCLDEVLNMNIDVHVVATNSNVAICKLMKTKYPQINHQLDIQDVGKRLSKRLLLASRKANCSLLADWIGPITNHLWWCTKTCNYNPNLLVEKWKSLMYHIADVHTFPQNKEYPKCEHKKHRRKNIAWLTEQHKAHQTLQSIVNAPELLNDIRKLEKFCHTGSLEVYRRKIFKFFPRLVSYRLDSVYARTALAALAHNRIVNENQSTFQCSSKSTVQLGKQWHKIAFPKKTIGWHSKPIYKEANDDHLTDIMRNTFRMLQGECHHG
ncbi:hypothetical protein GDO86_016377 [Hymenochirus boettgeri]|uniref:THAP-type domain-containing protein n=1 Tax=Hymenochirus boettgeri TaxID=247094 RepID=A0A8T2JWV1_9PIPI|nr:hypothetical protein GDO86_016377 [Hymenochirus boettgeri]